MHLGFICRVIASRPSTGGIFRSRHQPLLAVGKALDTCLDYATLVHPHEGPVNLYLTKRFANRKQRLMAGAENPTCAWPRQKGFRHVDQASLEFLTSGDLPTLASLLRRQCDRARAAAGRGRC